ncbi:MAG: Hsp20/alpha crystallin family protein [Candidatus Paceibacterota bacterium]|nr:MAG: Hsp20/alpha crystallin family protein [Candidatus Paceibacterota bacterium]
MIKKRSLIERLTGAVRVEEDEKDFDSEETLEKEEKLKIEEDDGEGQLSVDVFQNQNEIVIKTMVAGVRSEDLDVSITRDMVTIRGKREEERNVSADDYFHKELYWGSFSRTILLPQEVDIEAAEAVEKHGMLIIRLPKLDKDRQARLKVKNG